MANLIEPATLLLDEAGIPFAPRYGDVYHSDAGGYAQARGVFLAGNGLPSGWGGRRTFTIVETGFGLGTNFLATWAAWREDARRPRRLHFVSIERHPFRAADLRAWHRRDPAVAALGEALADAWPVLTPGLHRLEFDRGRVVLTLALGEAGAMLANLRLRADAFYLDGFSPSRNPEMWSAPVFQGMAGLAAPGARLATYTVARSVMDGLAAAGFSVRKAPGFGDKRDMLVGRFAGGGMPPAPGWSERHAMVIGAGIAGVSAAEALAARGWRVSLLEGAAGAARGASSTPAGAVHALLSRDDNRLTRFTRAAYLHMDRRLAAQPADWHAACGRIDCVEEGEEREGAADLIVQLGLPPEFVRAVDVAEASALAGTQVARGGYWFARGTWLHAASFCNAVLAAREQIVLHTGRAVAQLCRDGDAWVAIDAEGKVLASAPVAILAAALDLPRLAGITDSRILPLQRVRGQLSGLPAALCRAPKVVVSGDGYCLPPVAGMMWTGASYGPRDDDSTVRPGEHRGNLDRLARLLPQNHFGEVLAGCVGHVGFRAVVPDRLPLVGALPDAAAVLDEGRGQQAPALAQLPRLPGLYAAGAMASRGLTWSALAGETLACMIEGEPAPLEADLLDAIDPARFLARGLRRGTI